VFRARERGFKQFKCPVRNALIITFKVRHCSRTDFPWDIRSSSFVILVRSPPMTILHIFLSLSYSFLFVDIPGLQIFAPTVWKWKCSFALSEMSYFYDLQKSRDIRCPEPNFACHRNRAVKNPQNRERTRKAGTNGIHIPWSFTKRCRPNVILVDIGHNCTRSSSRIVCVL
jgi:hypothetical protein